MSYLKMEKLDLERDFSRFFDKEDFPHTVSVCLGGQQFATCSGMILAQQSVIIEDIICSHEGVLTLNNLENYSIPEILECFRYLYGADITLSMENIGTILTFSSLYEIRDMFSIAFDWILKNITVKYLITLFDISSNLSCKHKPLLLRVLDNFVADNISDVMMEVRNGLKDGKRESHAIGSELLFTILQQSFSSCGDIVLAWMAQDPSNVSFVLNNMDSIDMFKNFPQADEFAKLISCLSANADSLQTMEKLIELQQHYFTKVSKTPQNEQLVAAVDGYCESICNASHFYNLDEGLLHILQNRSDYFSTVSVSNVPVYASDDDVVLALAKVGPVKRVILINIDCFNQFGFVSFEDKFSANESLSCDIFLHRNKLAVKSFIKPSSSKCSDRKLFIKKVPVRASKRDIERCFSPYGPIKDIEIIRHKKCAFIELFDVKIVAMLIHLSMNGVTLRILGKIVSIENFKFKVDK